MNVLLLQSPLGYPYRPVFPHGLCVLATVLQDSGHFVRVRDANIDPDRGIHVQRLIEAFNPDVIGVSLRNIDTVRKNVPYLFHLPFMGFLTELKRLAPVVPLIAGGPGFSIFPEELMRRCPELDFGLYLEAEDSLPQLLDGMDRPETVPGVFYRSGGEVLFSGRREPPEVSKRPPVDRSFVRVSDYTEFPYDVGVETKRGCALNCAYCSYPHLNGRQYRLRPPARIVDEIEDLVDRYGLRNFSFIDSVFDVPREHCTAICRELIRRKVDVNWLAWFNGADFDEELFGLSYEAGCDFFCFSPDAYTPKALRGLKKHVRHKDINRIYRIFRRQRLPVKVTFNFFANSPETGLLDFLRTIAFCYRARFRLSHCLHRAGMDYIRILPDTPLYETALRKQVLDETVSLLPWTPEDFGRLFYHEPGSRLQDLLFKLVSGLQGRGYARK